MGIDLADAMGWSSGKEHPWVSVVVSSLGKGALADTFKRFTWLSAVLQTIFASYIQKMLQDTRKHESYSRELVER